MFTNFTIMSVSDHCGILNHLALSNTTVHCAATRQTRIMSQAQVGIYANYISSVQAPSQLATRLEGVEVWIRVVQSDDQPHCNLVVCHVVDEPAPICPAVKGVS